MTESEKEARRERSSIKSLRGTVIKTAQSLQLQVPERIAKLQALGKAMGAAHFAEYDERTKTLNADLASIAADATRAVQLAVVRSGLVPDNSCWSPVCTVPTWWADLGRSKVAAELDKTLKPAAVVAKVRIADWEAARLRDLANPNYGYVHLATLVSEAPEIYYFLPEEDVLAPFMAFLATLPIPGDVA